MVRTSSNFVGIAATLCLVLMTLLPARPLAAEVFWRGDFETGNLEQWRGTAIKSSAVHIVSN